MERDKGKSNKKRAKIEKEETKVTGHGKIDGSCNRHNSPDRVHDKRNSSRERYQHRRCERSQYSRHDDSWKSHDSPDHVPDRSSSQHPHKRSECSRYSGHDVRQRSMSPRGYSRGLVTPTDTVVMNGLPRETSEEDIHRILAGWGPLRDVRVMKRKNSTACRGIAFIDFPSVAAAQKMMDQIGDHGLDANGRKMCFAYREGNDDRGDNEKHEDECDYVDEVAGNGLPDSRAPEELRTLKVGDESYSAENNSVLSSLVRSAKALEDAFNSLEGVTCEKADEGLYLFPRIKFSQKAIKAADVTMTAPDAFYAKHLLEATGIVVLPGSHFGQVPGVWFIGLPILLQEEKIQREDITVIISRLTNFHKAFMTEFHD
ncbi:hypothetical protein MKW92_048431 [Papaver armeniacum]|nr:hypothetical protein MKW92_048431 [Papaver armeniacum]